jgi:hypothetical protein
MGCKVTPSRGAHGSGAARRDDERAQHHELGDCRAIHSERGRGRRRLTARRERRASWAWGWGWVVVQVQEAEGREAGRRQVDTDAGLGAGRVGVAMAMTPLRSPPATPPLTPRRASQTGREAKKGRPAMGVSACGSLSGALCSQLERRAVPAAAEPWQPGSWMLGWTRARGRAPTRANWWRCCRRRAESTRVQTNRIRRRVHKPRGCPEG